MTTPSIPVMRQNEILATLSQWRESKDCKYRDKIVAAHVGLVKHIAASIHKSGSLTLDDLIQEGNIGLLHAIKNYDVTQNVLFVSYAGVCIKGRIYTSISRNTFICYPRSDNRQKIFWKMAGILDELNSQNDKSDVRKAIAKRYKVTVADIEYMEQWYSTSKTIDIDTTIFKPDQYLSVDIDHNFNSKYIYESLRRIWFNNNNHKKPVQCWDVYVDNMCGDFTRKEMHNKHGLCRESIRQICILVTEHLKSAIDKDQKLKDTLQDIW